MPSTKKPLRINPKYSYKIKKRKIVAIKKLIKLLNPLKTCIKDDVISKTRNDYQRFINKCEKQLAGDSESSLDVTNRSDFKKIKRQKTKQNIKYPIQKLLQFVRKRQLKNNPIFAMKFFSLTKNIKIQIIPRQEKEI